MATQRLTIATLAGDAAVAVVDLLGSWRRAAKVECATVDGFCHAIRANGHQLPIVHYCEWIDRWLMGDRVPGPESIHGRQFEVTNYSREEALLWSDRCGKQWQEELWLAAMLREAACAWQELAPAATIIVIREPLGISTLDEEIVASLQVVPDWLAQITGKKLEGNK